MWGQYAAPPGPGIALEVFATQSACENDRRSRIQQGRVKNEYGYPWILVCLPETVKLKCGQSIP